MNDHIVISVGAAAVVGAIVAAVVAAASVGEAVAGVSVAAGFAQAAKVESKKHKTRRTDKNLTFFIARNSFFEC
jgi:hypothetical protein